MQQIPLVGASGGPDVSTQRWDSSVLEDGAASAADGKEAFQELLPVKKTPL